MCIFLLSSFFVYFVNRFPCVYVHTLIAYSLVPTLRVSLLPPLLIGDSGEDTIELLCTATVVEDVASASYQFTWIKDSTPISLLNDRIMVCITMYVHAYICN